MELDEARKVLLRYGYGISIYKLSKKDIIKKATELLEKEFNLK
jgi:hypothetical protein